MLYEMIVGDIIDGKYYRIRKQYEEISKEEYEKIFYKNDASENEKEMITAIHRRLFE